MYIYISHITGSFLCWISIPSRLLTKRLRDLQQAATPRTSGRPASRSAAYFGVKVGLFENMGK